MIFAEVSKQDRNEERLNPAGLFSRPSLSLSLSEKYLNTDFLKFKFSPLDKFLYLTAVALGIFDVGGFFILGG